MLEDGKHVAYYVDPYIAEAFQKKESGSFLLGVDLLKLTFNQYFRPMWITFNVGFQFYSNVIRDFGRTRRNVYALAQNGGYAGTLKSLLVAYKDSYKTARRYAKNAARDNGAGTNDATERDVHDDLLSEMIENKSLGVSFTDYSFDPDADQFTSLARKMGVAPPKLDGMYDKASKHALLKWPVKILEGVRFVGNTNEVLSKIAGYKVLKADTLKTMDKAIASEKDADQKKYLQEQRSLLVAGKGEYAHKLAYNVRNYVGTPNWRTGGMVTHVTNNLFPFSNIMIQGMKSDLEIASRPNTRNGFALDLVISHIVPKMLMLLAGAGAAGDALEEFYKKVSEYDKTNYIVIPLGFKDNPDGTRKAVYWRIPHDETARLAAAAFWKIGNAFRQDRSATAALSQIVNLGTGQLPKLAPPLTIAGTWAAYLGGFNPYDDFRGMSIMSDKVFKAGGVHSLKRMVQWTANTVGLASFATHDDANKSWLESALEVALLFNRILKVSDYGDREASMLEIARKQSEDARRSLDRGEFAREFTFQRYLLNQKKAAGEISSQERDRLSSLNSYNSEYLSYSGAIKRAHARGDTDAAKRFEDKLERLLSKVME